MQQSWSDRSCRHRPCFDSSINHVRIEGPYQPRPMRERSLVPQDSRTETEGAAGAADQGSRKGKRRLPRLPVFSTLFVPFDLASLFLPLPFFVLFTASHLFAFFPRHHRQLPARNTKRRYRSVRAHLVPPLVSVADQFQNRCSPASRPLWLVSV